ncbi:sterile alpha motif domain-containing protein 9-like [Aplochiton taeniatus]
MTTDSTAASRREGNQGEKLKNLLTCGGNTMDHYDRFVVVINKSQAGQLEYLQFLTKLKLFCVLDFDPNSATAGGVCHSYRQHRVANLHNPTQFQGETDVVVKNLNLYKQTSWVFCNGRHDLDLEPIKELDYKTWFKKACKDIEQLVTFICKPEVLLSGRTLVIFLLLSPVQSEKDPLFDTYNAFYKYKEGESIITICESESTFTKWRDLIQSKCESDITRQSICELTLSEVNGTVMALGPHNKSSERFLPSTDSSFLVLKQKDEDYMTALDILCQNQCENVYDETTTEFKEFKIKVEEEFFRGGKVKWWNFYFCEKRKAKPFIKRDKYDNLRKIIKSQKREGKNPCVLLNLFHHPGCGGTTLAMHVMWDLRKTFRCAVLKDHSLPYVEVALQVKKLMKLENEKSTPVLLLVDDSKEAENTKNLVKCIKAVVEDSREEESSLNSQVIVLNCVRSPNPKEQYQQCNTACQYITTSLTQKEQDDFEEKLQELKETHKKPENFYSFMIMKSNFDKKYIAEVVSHTLENIDTDTKEAKFFRFLALLNTHVAESDIALSLTEDFLGMKMIYWENDSVLDRMEPYSNLLIIDTVEDLGGYKGIRILGHSIASACLEEFDRSYHFTVSDITMEMLHCDLFFKTGVVKDNLMLSIQRMLIERPRKKDGDERETFSPLIEKIHNQQGRERIQDILVKASSRFFASASIPQALARYLYIKERDFNEAVIWAENAKKIKENPYTVDTIGQVYKSHLKQNMQNEKQIASNPDLFDTNLQLASKAIKAFQRAQELSNTEDESDNDSEDYPTKSYNIFGYVGEMEVSLTVVEMLSKLSFFDETDPMKRKYMQSYLKGRIPISSIPKTDSEIDNFFVEIIQNQERFLLDLKTQLKEIFEVFDCYFTYIKENETSIRGNSPGEYEARNRKKISDHFTKYMTLLCSSSEEIAKERKSNSKLNLNIEIEECRLYLEEKHADTFAGVLQHLDKDAKEMEKITEYYAFLQKYAANQKQKIKQKICYVLSNIILHLLNSKSVHVRSEKELIVLLKEILQDVGLKHPYPDPYYLALILLWPRPGAEDIDIRTHLNSIRNTSRGRLLFLFRKRSTVAHFYLGKQNGLARLVPKPKLDECFGHIARNVLAELWRSGDIFKKREIIDRLLRVRGTIELGEVFAIYGKQKISVRPAYLGGIRSGFSTEKVSFYIGFAIDGPLAYDIQYEN